MTTTFEPARQSPNFDIFYQQWLARLRNTEQLLEVVSDSSSLEGEFDSLEDVVAALVVATGKINTVVDLTSATSDYALSVNETAKITITAASTPLNIAVEDGVYEIDIIFDPATFAGDQTISLNPNNTTYTGLIGFLADLTSTAIATDEIDTVDAAVDEHRFSGSVAMRPHHAWGRLTISGTRTSMFSKLRGRTVAGNNYKFDISTSGDIAVPHASLGTLSIGEAATGTCHVKRIA